MAVPPAPALTPVYYSATEIGACALLGGFPQDQLQTVISVALAESSGQANAIGPVASGSRGYGLMQVMYPMHQDLYGDGFTAGWWIDGTPNMRMARAIYSSSGWSAWETYTTGRYRLYAGQAAAAAASLQASVSSSGNVQNTAQSILQPSSGRISAAQQAWAAAVGGTASPVASGGVLAAATAVQPTATPASITVNTGATAPLVRFTEVVLGTLLILVGAYLISRPVTQPVVNTVGRAARLAAKIK